MGKGCHLNTGHLFYSLLTLYARRGLAASLHTRSLRDPSWYRLHCPLTAPSGTRGLLVHHWTWSWQHLCALVWNVTCHLHSAACWSEPITWPVEGGNVSCPRVPWRRRKPMCVCTFRVFTQTMLLWPTETWVKGLACCLIPSILGTEKTTRFCSEPHYTRPRGLFITYRGKCHQMQGTVNLGNSHWKSVREKPLLNKIKINLWAVGLQWDDWDYLPDSRRKITSPREVFLGVTDANYRALVWGWLFLGLTHCKFLLK